MATEEEIALRTKKGNVRRAHRASATRLMNQIDGAIVSADVRRLKQLKQSLTNKLTVLVRLDDELIGLVEDDDLEAKVEQADETREKIDLAILTIEDALADYQGGTVTRDRADSSSSAPSGEDGQHDPSPTPSANPDDHPVPASSAPVSSVPITAVTSASTVSVTTTSSSLPSSLVDGTSPVSTLAHPAWLPTTAPFPSMTSLSGALPHPAGTLVMTTLASPTLSASGLCPYGMAYSVPSGAPMPVGALHPASYPVVATSHSLSPAPHMPAVTRPSVHAAVPQVKLPKLSIKKFGGDLTKWVTFWDTFEPNLVECGQI